jgi:L-ascorbate metabolism protein UlaG (beta-lactamase superfamily)
MGKGGSQKIGDFEVTMTHAFHSNSIDDHGLRHYGGEPAGFIIRNARQVHGVPRG